MDERALFVTNVIQYSLVVFTFTMLEFVDISTPGTTAAILSNSGWNYLMLGTLLLLLVVHRRFTEAWLRRQ